MERAMLSCKCLYWNNLNSLPPLADAETFSLPAPIPQWPPGKGFASGRINLGELEVTQISTFEFIWGYSSSQEKKKSVSFYKPVGIPEGFHCLGHYCQSNSKPLRGFVLVGGEASSSNKEVAGSKQPVLAEPLDYSLVWSSNDLAEGSYGECGYFWLPQPPEGYKPMGYVVTSNPEKPKLHEVRCARADLTDRCDAHKVILHATSKFWGVPLWVWRIRPSDRGMWGKGVSTGTFFCTSYQIVAGEELDIACLRNSDSSLCAMPNIDQIHALIQHYGPTVFFHPEETYLPSSVSWFFKNGALLYKKGDSNSNSKSTAETIDENGSNLPSGGSNDKKFWIDLPSDNERRNTVKCGNLQSAKLYAHVKPASGGTFTDIAFWVFCPFNGPATLKLGLLSVPFGEIGQHVGDWEHFTLRISNFTGELFSIYFSQHSGGEWVEAYDLEYIQGNRAIVYSSKHGHASFSRPGTYIQGSSKLGIGIRNDAARSRLFVDSSVQYEIVAAEYLGEGVVTEPGWLLFMREWGPVVVYDSRTEIDKIINRLPLKLRCSVAAVFKKLPVELYGEEGPTGPKEKNNWFGDERW